jgi:hypothetical protein
VRIKTFSNAIFSRDFLHALDADASYFQRDARGPAGHVDGGPPRGNLARRVGPV